MLPATDEYLSIGKHLLEQENDLQVEQLQATETQIKDRVLMTCFKMKLYVHFSAIKILRGVPANRQK